MKTKQLANILIKIVGLSLLLHAIPGFVSGVFTGLLEGILGFPTSAARGGVSIHSLIYPLATGAAGIVVFVIAIPVIVKSREITNYLFKDEDE
jgi:hypothetical protein